MEVAVRSAVLVLLAFGMGVHAAPAVEMPKPGTPLAHWTDAERQGAFRFFDKVLPSQVVKRGETVFPLPEADRKIDPRMEFDGAELSVDDFMKANHVSGLIAVKNGKIVLERYAFGRKPDQRWVSFSVTKSITSTLLGAAIADGHIKSLNDKVTRYLPELKGSAYDAVSIRDLLTMRSGVAWNEDYGDPTSDVYQVGMLPPIGGLNPTARYMKALKRAGPPGKDFLYNTGETDLAGLLVSAAVGKPLAQYLSEKIWAPFGMESDALWPKDTGGHERGGCCLNMTLRDYARFGLFALGGGVAGGRPVVPAGWMKEATTAHNTAPPYGYFWWIRRDGGYQATGIHGQGIHVLPQQQLVVAVNSAWPLAWEETYFARQLAMVEAIGRASAK
jgi:CubicO group peptidase (beta-lactamase class C family)